MSQNTPNHNQQSQHLPSITDHTPTPDEIRPAGYNACIEASTNKVGAATHHWIHMTREYGKMNPDTALGIFFEMTSNVAAGSPMWQETVRQTALFLAEKPCFSPELTEKVITCLWRQTRHLIQAQQRTNKHSPIRPPKDTAHVNLKRDLAHQNWQSRKKRQLTMFL